MRGASKAAARFIALLLTFILGFATCVGAIVGVAYFVYAKVSLDTLTESDVINLDTSKFLEEDSVLTSLTIKDLVDEIKLMAETPDTISISMLVDKYGVKISEDIRKYIPDDVYNASFKEFSTGEGRKGIFKNIYIGTFLGYTKESNPAYDPTDENSKEFLWYDKNNNRVEGIEAVLAAFNLYEIMNGNLNYDSIIDSVTIADVMSLKKDELVAFTQDADGNLVSVPGVDTVTVWYQNNGSEAGLLGAVAGSSISSVGSSLDDMNIADVIGYVSAPVFDENGAPVLDENGKQKLKMYKKEVAINENNEKYVLLTEEKDGITTELGDLQIGELSGGALDDKVNNIELITVLGYEQREDGKWYTKEGALAESFMVAMLYGPDGEPTTINNISDTIGGVKVGDFAGYTYDTALECWLDGDGNEAEGILASLADLTVDEMTDNGKLTDKIQTLELVDVLGYEEHDGVWYEEYYGVDDANNKRVTNFMAALVINENGEHTKVNEVAETVDKMTVGALTGYEKGEDDKWYNDEGEIADGILGALIDMTVEEMSDGDALTARINGVELYVVLDYENVDGVWYEEYYGEGDDRNKEASSLMAALFEKDGVYTTIDGVSGRIDNMLVGEFAGFTYDEENEVWLDKDGKTAKGVLAALSDLYVTELSDESKLTAKIKTVEVGYALGYHYDEVNGVWYETYFGENHANNKEPTGVMAAIAGTPIGSIQDKIDVTPLGELLGYKKNGDAWKDADGEDAHPILAAIADLQFNELSDKDALTEKVQTIKVGDALGYEQRTDGWYDEGDKVSGVMGVIAGEQIANIEDKINSADLGEILGYEKKSDGWYNGTEKVTGVMAVVADSNINNLHNTIEDTQMGEFLGFTYDEDEKWWYDDSNEKVHVLMNSISGKKISEMGNLASELTVEDLIPAEERTGYVQLLFIDVDENGNVIDDPEPVKLDKLSTKISDIFTKIPLSVLVDKEIVTFKNDENGFKKQHFVETFGDLTIDGLIQYVSDPSNFN